MSDFENFEKMTKKERELMISTMPVPTNATPEESQRFEFLRQIALGRKLSKEEFEAMELGRTINAGRQSVQTQITGAKETRCQ